MAWGCVSLSVGPSCVLLGFSNGRMGDFLRDWTGWWIGIWTMVTSMHSCNHCLFCSCTFYFFHWTSMEVYQAFITEALWRKIRLVAGHHSLFGWDLSSLITLWLLFGPDRVTEWIGSPWLHGQKIGGESYLGVIPHDAMPLLEVKSKPDGVKLLWCCLPLACILVFRRGLSWLVYHKHCEGRDEGCIDGSFHRGGAY